MIFVINSKIKNVCWTDFSNTRPAKVLLSVFIILDLDYVDICDAKMLYIKYIIY